MRNYRLPPLFRWDLRSYGMLRSVQRYLPTFRDNLSFGLIGCRETSVRNYKSTLRNIPEQCRYLNAYSISYKTITVTECKLAYLNHMMGEGSVRISFWVVISTVRTAE